MSLVRCRYLRVILQAIAVLGGRKGGPISLEKGYLSLVVRDRSDTTVYSKERLGLNLYGVLYTIGTIHHV